jgi:hypothetical protein
MITLTREEAQSVLDAVENIPHFHNAVIETLRARLAQPEPEPEHADALGSPCPEFWDWLPKAYGQRESFTKYNMEVAFLAGAQLSARQQPVAYMGTDIEGNPNKFRLNAFGGSIPLYTAPPQREWQGFNEHEIGIWRERAQEILRWAEQVLKEKNSERI